MTGYTEVRVKIKSLEGKVLVPLEPNNERIQAGILAFEKLTDGDRLPDGDGADLDIMAGIYKAMIQENK